MAGIGEVEVFTIAAVRKLILELKDDEILCIQLVKNPKEIVGEEENIRLGRKI